ncbi:MAG: flagellar biosynthesis protein FliC [Ignavibacteriales bacterium]|jgi:flagellin|nr:MAG: flagellar biosynthesis protein FliC [Ignavibacteriales bacterium]
MSNFRIASNIGALEAYNALAKLNSQTQKAQLRLATQKRINSVADDTSGFNIGKSLESKVALMQSAQKNVGSAKDMLSTAESQLVSVRDMITQIRGKIADSGNAAADLNALASDVRAIADEINSAISNTKFNNTELLTSTSAASGASGGMKFQTGVTTSDQLDVSFSQNVAVHAEAVSDAIGTAGVDLIATRSDFEGLETSLNTFESTITSSLGKIGNLLQRLDVKDDFLTSAITNSQASVSRLFDADVAVEQLNATKYSIGAQAATAMVAQMNFAPQQVLQLFG